MWPVAAQAVLALLGLALIVQELFSPETSAFSVAGLCLFTSVPVVGVTRAWRSGHRQTP